MSVTLRLQTNVDQVLKDLDNFADAVINTAAPRALNKLRDQAKTAGFRKVSEVYGIGPRTMDRYASLKFASAKDLIASINVKGKGFPLSVFNPRQTRGGVSVQIKGKRVVIPHTFMARMPNGHVGVFGRGTYGATFRFGKGRHRNRPRAKRTELPIHELYSFAPSDAFSNPEVVEAMNDRIAEQMPKVVAQEIRFAAR